jgi:hypothetical protein
VLPERVNATSNLLPGVILGWFSRQVSMPQAGVLVSKVHDVRFPNMLSQHGWPLHLGFWLYL